MLVSCDGPSCEAAAVCIYETSLSPMCTPPPLKADQMETTTDFTTGLKRAICDDKKYPASTSNGGVGNFWCKQYNPACTSRWCVYTLVLTLR